MTIRTRIGILLSSLFLVASTSLGQLTVLVSDESDLPIPEAEVHVFAPAEIAETLSWRRAQVPYDLIARGNTGPDGLYACSPERGGAYLVVAQRDHYGVAWRAILVKTPMSDNTLYHMVLPPERQIVGRVLDESGRPIAQATVTPLLRRHTGEDGWGDGILGRIHGITDAVTDADGLFVLNRIPAAAHVNLFATHPDYAPSSLGPGSRRSGESGAPQRAPETHPDLVMSKGGLVRGRVKYAYGGQPASGVDVMVRIPAMSTGASKGSDFSWIQPETTDAEGAFALRAHHRGNYQIIMMRPDWPITFKEERLYIEEDMYNVVEAVDILIPLMPVRGRFVNTATGAPVPGSAFTSVSYPAAQGGRPPNIRIDSEGRFVLYAIPPSMTIEGLCVLDGYEMPFWVDLGPPQQRLAEVVAGVTPPIVLEGIVERPDGAPVAGATVMTGFGDTRFTVQTLEDGAFALPVQWGISPEFLCRWLREASPGSLTLTMNAISGDALLFGTDQAQIPRPPQASTLDERAAILGRASSRLVLTPAAVCLGRVVDQSGMGIAGARVLAHPVEGTPRDILSRIRADEWRVPITDEDGYYEIHGIRPDTPYAVSAFTRDWTGRLPDVVTTADGERRRLPDLRLPGLRMVSGCAVDTGGKPVKGATVIAKGRLTEARVAVTDENGWFFFDGINAEKIELTAVANRPRHMRHGASLAPFENEARIELRPVRKGNWFTDLLTYWFGPAKS